MREEAVSEQTNNFLCIHRLRSRFPLLADYNLLLSTLISIIVPMALESSCPRTSGAIFPRRVRARPLTQRQSLREKGSLSSLIPWVISIRISSKNKGWLGGCGEIEQVCVTVDSTVADRGIKIGRTIQCLGGWLDLCRLESGEWRESLVEEKTVVVAVVVVDEKKAKNKRRGGGWENLRREESPGSDGDSSSRVARLVEGG
ncbi:hypothetical protein KQX54_021801 [Cotesia glomerata]|uniref:Uncharacterized protein n=1 Tax=Cotesia glomerata TaxID=32391 RepID=A0AAV7JA31_COTGL|nr:hypothetical protein KQX54_021801 [Cotesia glomerata]